jgi:hypothetical protein
VWTCQKKKKKEVNLNVRKRYKRLCLMQMRLAIETTNNEDTYAFVEKIVNKMQNHVLNIEKGSSVTFDNKAQSPLSDNNKIANHTLFVNKLIETVKWIKKMEG